MKLKIDKESDVLYFRLDDTEIVESEEVQSGFILDFDKDGRVVGIEILSLSTRFAPEKLRILQCSDGKPVVFARIESQQENGEVKFAPSLFVPVPA